MRIILEALKIDKMPKAYRVRLWFLLLFSLSSLAYLTMPSGGRLELFQSQLNAFLQRQAGLPFPPLVWFSVLFRQVGLIVVALWFILLYALHWLFASSDLEGQVEWREEAVDIPPLIIEAGQTPTAVALKAFPAVLLLAFTMILPYLISVPVLGIPFYVLASMLSMSAFIFIFENKGLSESMEASHRMTRGMKLFIFVSFLFLGQIANLASDLFRLILGSSLWAGSLIRAFFFAFKTLAFGRLAAMFYRSLSAKEALVQSRPLDGF